MNRLTLAASAGVGIVSDVGGGDRHRGSASSGAATRFGQTAQSGRCETDQVTISPRAESGNCQVWVAGKLLQSPLKLPRSSTEVLLQIEADGFGLRI